MVCNSKMADYRTKLADVRDAPYTVSADISSFNFNEYVIMLFWDRSVHVQISPTVVGRFQ